MKFALPTICSLHRDHCFKRGTASLGWDQPTSRETYAVTAHAPIGQTAIKKIDNLVLQVKPFVTLQRNAGEMRLLPKRTTIRLLRDNRGVTAIEYTMIAALIAMAIIVGVTQIGGFVKTSFETVAGSI